MKAHRGLLTWASVQRLSWTEGSRFAQLHRFACSHGPASNPCQYSTSLANGRDDGPVPQHPAPQSASERGDWALSIIEEAGRRQGHDVEREYAVPGGRIDIVWLWKPTEQLPQTPESLPLVGFEVESSWRTRKHVKGDLLNLQDLGAGLGVIVLLGTGEKVESLRRFARAMVDRATSRVVIWSETDIEALASQSPTNPTTHSLPISTEPTRIFSAGPTREHTGKYRKLWRWLLAQTDDPPRMSFSDIERILGFRLPPSSRKHPAHWSSYEGSAVVRAIVDAGWKATQVSISSETLVLERRP